MGNSFFKFKHFTVHQSRSAMKVGTDGVLLGAWAGLVAQQPKHVLDIGTGTGVVALMMAQRFLGAMVDAVEIDEGASEDAASNFQNSPWNSRLSITHCALQSFGLQQNTKYDIVVSNPPYFIGSLKNNDPRLVAARHTDSLSHADLLDGVVRLMADDGLFSAIFPYREANIFIAEAALSGLFLQRRMDVYASKGKAVKRVLVEFKKQSISSVCSESLVLETTGKERSLKYKEMTAEFYL